MLPRYRKHVIAPRLFAMLDNEDVLKPATIEDLPPRIQQKLREGIPVTLTNAAYKKYVLKVKVTA